jgi:hypothetical protein
MYGVVLSCSSTQMYITIVPSAVRSIVSHVPNTLLSVDAYERKGRGREQGCIIKSAKRIVRRKRELREAVAKRAYQAFTIGLLICDVEIDGFGVTLVTFASHSWYQSRFQAF